MIKIRKGAFETNSSSMHTFIFAKNTPQGNGTTGSVAYIEKRGVKKERTVLVIENIDFSEYGSDYVLTEWFDKLAYAIAYMMQLECPYDKNDVNHILSDVESKVKKYHPEIDEIIFPEVDLEYGYFINHQSHDNMADFMINENISWEDVVFNDHYVIVPTADCVDYDTIIREVKSCGYSGIEYVTAWSKHKVVDDNEVLDAEYDE